MDKNDELLRDLLIDPAKVEEYITSSRNPEPGKKKYQIVQDIYRNLGFIFYSQHSLIAVVENVTPNLCRFLGETDIIPTALGGKNVEDYLTIDIRIYGLTACGFRRSLGKIVLIGQGKDIVNGQTEAHHEVHTAINTSSAVKKESKKRNAALHQELLTSQVTQYIKDRILRMNDYEYDRYLNNLRFLCMRYKKKRGIYFNIPNLEAVNLTADMLNEDIISLSVY